MCKKNVFFNQKTQNFIKNCYEEDKKKNLTQPQKLKTKQYFRNIS